MIDARDKEPPGFTTSCDGAQFPVHCEGRRGRDGRERRWVNSSQHVPPPKGFLKHFFQVGSSTVFSCVRYEMTGEPFFLLARVKDIRKRGSSTLSLPATRDLFTLHT